MIKVERPKADQKKIRYNNQFELCYLRHQYIRKVDFNPSETEMAPYMSVVTQLAKNTYFTYQNLFRAVGFEMDDVVNIGQVHLVSFLGLFSMDKLPQKYDEFLYKHIVKNGRDPNAEDVMDKNKANLTMFLKQRMEDLVRVCRQKVRNIKGFPSEEYYAYSGPNRPPLNTLELVSNYDRYGFNKVDIAVFKTIRKRAKEIGASSFKFNGTYYVSVKCVNQNLSISDFSGADMDPHDSIHNMSPDRIFFDREETSFWEDKRVEFDGYSSMKKTRLLQSFIDQNNKKDKFKEEVKLAKHLLREIGA